MRKWAVTGMLPLALVLASGPASAQSEVETLRSRVHELEQQQQRTDAELDELRALLVGEGGAPRAPLAASAAPVPDADIDLGVLAGESEGSILSRIDFHGHLAVDYVGIAKPSAGSVEPSRDPDAELLPRSSFTASDLTFFIGLPIYENVYAATEVEYESGGDEVTLDQAFVQWDLASEEKLSLRGGKFYFPFGIDRYYQNAPTNPLVDRPAPFLFVIPETYSETGIELLGELSLAHSPELVGEYEFALVNGLGEPAFASVRDARQNRDNNSAKAWGGRLGLVWDRWLRVGVSGLSGNYDSSNDDGLWAAGVDLRADWGSVALRGEWAISRVENPDAISADGTACPSLPCPDLEPLTPLGGSFSRQGWYVEGIWRPRPVFAQFLGPLEYVLRYDVLDDDQDLQDVLDGQRFAAGIVFHPREHFRLKAEYEIVDDESSEVENNGFLFQGSVGLVSAPDVAVLGAGPAGLACAWELASRGARVVVLEASQRVGGLAATTERDGFRFDQGGHRFLTRWPELLERVRKLMADELLLVDRHSVVVSDGRRFGYPLELSDLLRNVPLRRGLRYVASWAAERLRRPARDESTFEGWMVRRFGPALYAEFFAPYSRKLWGIEPSRLSSDWAPQRIGSFDLGFALRDLLGLARTRPRTVARRFLYPRLGMGQLFDAIAHEVERLGGSIRLGARVVGLALEGGRVRAARTDAGELEARTFVSTLPLPELVRFLGGDASLRFRGLRFLNLMFDAPAQLGSTWAYLSDGAGLVSRVQEPARRSPFMVPPGRGSLQLELPCAPGEPGFELDDASLFARVWPEVARAGLVIPAGVSGCFSTRAAHAYPVFDHATAAELARAHASAARFGNLALVGRQGRFSYVFADRAMEEGIAAARRILGVREGLPDPSCESPCLTEAQSLVG